MQAGGGLRPLALTPNANSPSWLLSDPSAGRLIAAEEGGDHIAVYQQTADGSLRLKQRLPSGRHRPVHLSMAQGRLWAAPYGDAHLAAQRLQRRRASVCVQPAQPLRCQHAGATALQRAADRRAEPGGGLLAASMISAA